MSTFSGLNTAYTGLVAARQGLTVVGQNITNATTTGYTRQRVTTSAIGALPQVGRLSGGIPQVGQGVAVSGVARLGDIYLDAQVRNSAATSGNLAVTANALTAVETSLQEPGTNGLSAQLTGFWADWQGMANNAGEPAQAGVLIADATALTSHIASGYRAVDSQWSQVRGQLDGMASELNDAGAQVADLNGRIRSTLATGGSVNELLDQRSTLTTTIAALTGATVRILPDGTADVLIGGNALVSGDTFQPVAVTGSSIMAGAAATPVVLTWANRPGVPVGAESGEMAGAVAILTAANATGTGGALAEAAASYNSFATYLATTVNAVHSAGVTSTGATGLDFFAIAPTGPAALGLSVLATSVADIATASAGSGALDGSNGDAIAALGTAPASPDSVWSKFVTTIGVSTKSAVQQATLAETAATSASSAQLANGSVDMDEENVNMLTFQKAYQGAARVMTAVDEMLDTLINHTGIVGR
ncbi:MAG TPA: flagellar hook-associated protein FlgK [Microbacteriaceae bacterium]|nr:flagellar hook-associated protein FlgK [Microbacteriaceae bacterium]